MVVHVVHFLRVGAAFVFVFFFMLLEAFMCTKISLSFDRAKVCECI